MTASDSAAASDPAASVHLPAARLSSRGRLLAAAAALMLAGGGTLGGGSYLYWAGARDPMARAMEQLNRGEVTAAQILLRGVVRDRPKDPQAHWMLGLAHNKQGDPVAAEREFRAAGALGADADQLRLPLASALLTQRKAQEALDLLASGNPGPDDLPRILVARADALEQLEDLAGAAATLDAAARLAPGLIDVPLAAGGLALRRSDVAVAERHADRALLISGRSADALLLKAQAVEQRGQRSAALDILAKAVAADPKAQHVRLERTRMLLAAGRTADARTEVDALLAAEPASVMANYLKAGILLQDGDYAAADEYLERLTRHVPHLPGGWYAVAAAKLHLEQLERAAEAADKHVARAPDDLDGRKLRARIGLAAKRPDQALAVLDAPLAAGTADAETFDLAGVAQAMAGRLADAERSLISAATLAPQDAGIHARLGSTRLLVGDAPGAVEALERSLALAPAQPGVGEQLVVAAVAAGKADRAAAVFADVRQRSGDTASTGQLDAILALAQFDLDAASARLANVAAKYPADSSARLQLARVLAMQGRNTEAETALAALLAKEPAHEAALNLLVPILERSGRLPRAAAVLESARAAAPANPRLTLMLSALRARAGDHAGALAAFGAQFTQPDTPVPLLLARASAEADAGKPDAARRIYEALLGSAPANPAVVLRFAEFLATQGAADEAVQHLAAGLAASPGNPDIQRSMVRLRYRSAGMAAALATADALRREPANLPAATLLRGDILLAAGRFVDAAAAYQAELRAVPSSLLAIRAAAAADSAHGPAAAIQILQAWTADHPDDLAALTMLATMHFAAKQSYAAATVLEQVIAREPNDPGVMNNLAWAYYDLSDTRAFPLALRAYLTTFNPNVADTLGCILLNESRTKEALTLLRFAARELPDNLSVQLHLALATRQAGLRNETRTLLSSLVKQDFEGRATARQLLADIETQ